MGSNSNWPVTNPGQRRIFQQNHKRELRSNAKEGKVIFVGDTNRTFGAGRLNTNTNNSGPDEVDRNWASNIAGSDFLLSADEDQGSDLDGSRQPTTSNFELKPLPAVRVSKKQFQTNMSGLSDDEANEFAPNLYGNILRDDQYDITSFLKPKIPKSRQKRTSKSGYNHTRLRNVLYSFIGILSYFSQCLHLLVLAFLRCMTLACTNLISARWYLLLPLLLPLEAIKCCVYWCAYTIDRMFGSTFARRWMSCSNGQSTITILLMNTLWFLFWVSTSLILMHLLLGHHSGDLSTGLSLLSRNGNNSSNYAGRRWMGWIYCWITFPIRWLKSDINQNSRESKETTMILQGNFSNLHDILHEIQERLKMQDEMITTFIQRISEIENDSAKRIFENQIYEQRQLYLDNEIVTMLMKFERFYNEFLLLQTLKESMLNYVKNVSDSQKEIVRSINLDIEMLSQKWDHDIKMIEDAVRMGQSESNGSTKDLSSSLLGIQYDIGQLFDRVDDISTRTTYLEVVNYTYINNSAALKEEIREEMLNELRISKIEQEKIAKKLNEQMSKVEEQLDKDYSKLLGKEYLSTMIEAQIGDLESNISKKMNTSMWDGVKQHVRDLLAAFRLSGSLNAREYRCSCARALEVKKMIVDSLRLYSADKIGIADFALESAGGTIVTTRCTETYTDRSATLSIFGVPLLRLTNSPRTIIQPNVQPGECWAMKGSKGSVVVKLSAHVRVTAVSIDHIPKSISPSGIIDSAVKDFQIQFLANESDSLGHSMENFTFLVNGASVQTFLLKEPIVTNLVEMIVNSNYGNEEYTCIYRFRVHGRAVKL